MYVILNSRLMELIVLVLTFAVVNGKPTQLLPESFEATKDQRQFDFNRDNYDPYDAQASAVAFRRYKEAQALKQGRFSNANNNEDVVLVASASDNADTTYEKRFYDPFFYFNSPRTGNHNSADNYDNNASGSGKRNGRLSTNSYDYGYNSPIYSTGRNGGIRSRRNTASSSSAGRDIIDNNIFNEDVHFFRRDPSTQARNKERLDEYEKSPYFYRESQLQSTPPRYFKPSTTTEFFTPNNRNYYLTRLEQPVGSRQNTVIGGRPPYYAPQFGSNHIDYNYFDGPRIPLYNGRESSQVGVPGANGWAVQVGTQLKVRDDDGRIRNPSRYYVRDERPNSIGRYPHHRDRQ